MTVSKVQKKNRTAVFLLFVLILLLGFAVRITDLDDPPLDFHGTRQLRSLILARDFYLQTRQDTDADLAARSRDLSQLEAYEPPILERLIAFVYRLMDAEDWRVGRLLSSLFWVCGSVFIALAAWRISSIAGAAGSVLILMFFPMSVIMSRSIQPDPWMCAWLMAAIWVGLRWAEDGRKRDILMTAVFGGVSILVKAFAGFFIAGLLAGVWVARLSRDGWVRSLRTVVFVGAAAVAPTVIYALSLGSERSGGFVSFWVVSLGGMIWKPRFYAEWLAMLKGLISLPMIFIALVGVFTLRRERFAPILGAWAGYFAYGLTVPYQVTTHEYYSLMIYPLTALSAAPVFALIWEKIAAQGRIRQVAAALIVGFGAFYGAYVAVGMLRASDERAEPASWARAGAAIPEDARLIGLTGDYGMRLNYYGLRRLDMSWQSSGDERLFQAAGRDTSDFEARFDALTAEIDYFFISSLGELAAQPELAARLNAYPLAAEGNGFLLYDLRQKEEEKR